MKLYRGIKAQDYSEFTPDDHNRLKCTWRSLLERRESGDLSYPEELNHEILDAWDLIRLQRQHFTDDQEIAATYAKDNAGRLIEIEVSVADILKHFTLEFQKFAQRRKKFEIVYVIEAAQLFTMSKSWDLKVILN